MKNLFIRIPTVINHLNEHTLPIKIYGEYYSHFTHTNAIAVLPFPGSLFQINSDDLTHQLSDRLLDRFRSKRVRQVPTSEEFLRLLRKKEIPLHERLYPYSYRTDSLARRLFVKFLDI